MNADMIDLYRGVQHRRGNWKKFDSCWHPNRGMGTITAIFREAACLEVEFPGGKRTYFHTKEPKDLLWLPPVYSDDERCLWKMVDWERFDVQVEDAGYVMVSSFSNVPWGHPICAPRPLPEALLRAIREQEGDHEE